MAAHVGQKDMREDKPKRAGRKAEGEPVTQMLNLLMSFQEAKDLNVSGSGVLQNIFDNPLTQLPERVMAKQLVNAWSAQTRDAAEVSKYSSRSWPPRRSFAFSQSSRIDPVGQRRPATETKTKKSLTCCFRCQV